METSRNFISFAISMETGSDLLFVSPLQGFVDTFLPLNFLKSKKYLAEII